MLSRRMGAAGVVYGLLGAAAVLWTHLAGRSLTALPRADAWLGGLLPDASARAGVSLALGVGVTVAAVRGTRVLVRRTVWARRLHVELRALVGPLRGRGIAFFALTSGVAEELFFRGAMQPALGLLLTSLIFGAVHLGPTRAFLPWTLWACVMGFVFGVLYLATGSLLGPVVAHVLINYENMHYLVSYDPNTVARERRVTPEAPSLMGARIRTSGRPSGGDER